MSGQNAEEIRNCNESWEEKNKHLILILTSLNLFFVQIYLNAYLLSQKNFPVLTEQYDGQ